MPVVLTSRTFQTVIVNRNCVAPLVGKIFSIPASKSENDHSDQDDTYKMIFIVDCHTRVCASEPIQNLDKSYKVVGYVRLGAGVSVLVGTAN
jgi:hypothetical protein